MGLIVALIAFICVFGFYYGIIEPKTETLFSKNADELMVVDTDSGFYAHAITVKVKKTKSVPFGAQIYYTLDGNDPTTECLLYTGSISLEVPNQEDQIVWPLKIALYYRGQMSKPIERTYVLNEKVEERYTMPVLNVTIDHDSLYDYETGIWVPGKSYDDNVALGKKGKKLKSNYHMRGDEWIRNAHVTMFSKAGDILLDQNVGMGVQGNTSAHESVKSFKLVADEKYDEQNKKLMLDFLRGDISYSKESIVSTYNTIKLHAGGQDLKWGNVRSAVVSRLCREVGFDGNPDTYRCIVYLNGKYQGVYDMQQRMSASFLCDKYGLEDTACIEKMETIDNKVWVDTGLEPYLRTDLNSEENRKMLEQKIDVDQMLLYYAIEMLLNNTDWPNNNFGVWRYTGKEEKNNPYSDGRWRFWIYDVDAIWHAKELGERFDGDSADLFQSCMEGQYRAKKSVFVNLMDSAYYRSQFFTIVADLQNTAFDSEHICQVIDEEYARIHPEQLLTKSYETNAFYDLCIDATKRFVYEKEKMMEKDAKLYFGLEQKMKVSFECSEGASIIWNQMRVSSGETYENSYYIDNSFEVEKDINPGYDFLYWIVNGKRYSVEDKLIVDKSLLNNGEIRIGLAVKRRDTEQLVIDEVSARGDNDWIKITNVGTRSCRLADYYISDRKKKQLKCELPDVLLNAGESVIINGSKNYEDISEYICNFSLGTGEMLYLSRYDGQVIDKLWIPKMDRLETYGRVNHSNQFIYYANGENQRKAL